MLIWCIIMNETDSFSKAEKIIFLLTISLFPTLHLVSSFLWTESLFIFISSLSFLSFCKWQKNRSPIWLVGLLLTLIFAVWTRKIGILFFVSFPILLLMNAFKGALVRWTIASFCIGAAIVFWEFVYVGESPNYHFFLTNLKNNLNGLVNWFLPVSFPLSARFLMGFIIIFLLFVPSRNPTSQWIKVFFFFYFSVRLFSEREHAEEADRYFSILYVPVVYHFLLSISFFVKKSRKWKQILFFVFLGFLLLNFSRTINNALLWHNSRESILEIDEEFNVQPRFKAT